MKTTEMRKEEHYVSPEMSVLQFTLQAGILELSNTERIMYEGDIPAD